MLTCQVVVEAGRDTDPQGFWSAEGSRELGSCVTSVQGQISFPGPAFHVEERWEVLTRGSYS